MPSEAALLRLEEIEAEPKAAEVAASERFDLSEPAGSNPRPPA